MVVSVAAQVAKSLLPEATPVSAVPFAMTCRSDMPLTEGNIVGRRSSPHFSYLPCIAMFVRPFPIFAIS